ncbi:MAG TPA: DUF6542 domain-containing protein [Streptosporangiaceae bacterium]|jgi:hypothetical protein
MEDAPTGPLYREDSPAGFTGTESTDTDASGAEAAPADRGPAASRRTGGRRYRAGHPPPQRRRAYEPPGAGATPFRSGLGASGTLAGLFACCLAGCLLAAWLHLIVLAGLGFCAGCGLAAWYCQPPALLRVVIAVPTVFLLAEVLAQLATLQGHGRRGLTVPVAGGTLLTLAAVAPWLFAGTAGAVAIGLFRGLPQCVRDLRAALRGRAPRGPRVEEAPRTEQARLR